MINVSEAYKDYAQDRISKLMEEKNVTVDDLFKATGIKKTRLKRYAENNIDDMPVTEIKILAQYFDVNELYLIGMVNERSWVFTTSDGEVFTTINKLYDESCRMFVEHLKDKKTVTVEGKE